jgi:hypothetical protein
MSVSKIVVCDNALKAWVDGDTLYKDPEGKEEIVTRFDALNMEQTFIKINVESSDEGFDGEDRFAGV